MGHLPRRLSGVCSFFSLATRGHDILHSDWGEKILHRSVHRVDSCFRVQCTTMHVLLSYQNCRCFNYCQQIFVGLFFVALLPYENTVTTKLSQITAIYTNQGTHTSCVSVRSHQVTLPLHTRVPGSGLQFPFNIQVAVILSAGINPGSHPNSITLPVSVL